MKLSVFSGILPHYDIEETIALLAECGYEGVEWRYARRGHYPEGTPPSYWGYNRSTIDVDADQAELAHINRLTRETGLDIVNVGAYISCGDLEATAAAMHAAALLDSPSLRIGVPKYNRLRSYAEQLEEGRTYLRDVQAMSRSCGVKGLVEMHHGNIACSASLARRLVEGFDPQSIGVIYDPGNFVFEGFEPYRIGLELLGEYLAHVHVKNAVWRTSVARGWSEDVPTAGREPLWRADFHCTDGGIVHWPDIIADLRAVEYDGWLSVEDFSAAAPERDSLRRNRAYLLSLLKD